MRILVVSNKCPPDYDGGYELSAFQVARALRGRGHDVQLVTSFYRESYRGVRSDPDWVHRIFQYLEWPAITTSGPARWLADARRFASLTNIGVANAEALGRYIGEKKPDLAYCFGFHGIGLATGYALAPRSVPVLWHAGNYLIAQDLQLRRLVRRHRFAHRLGMHVLSRKALAMILQGDYRHIAFLSEAMIREFRRMGFEPAHSYVIPRGIDFELTPADHLRAEEPCFLLASRISEEKGHDVAVDAAGILAKEMPGSWKLMIAGSGRSEYVQALIQRADRLGIGERVEFLGMLGREEVLERMRSSLAFISPSLWEEPFGRTNIEAMACATPLIAADTGAIREIVGDAECALLYDKRNPGELANHMRTVMERPEVRRQLVARGLDRIRTHYTMERILDLTESTFEKVLLDYGAQR